ncbi:unnamed protein product [Musa acuminata subsp. burmannicoides]
MEHHEEYHLKEFNPIDCKLGQAVGREGCSSIIRVYERLLSKSNPHFEEFEDLLTSSEKYHITYFYYFNILLILIIFTFQMRYAQHCVPTLEEHLPISLISSA